jgi:hypothetical protein
MIVVNIDEVIQQIEEFDINPPDENYFEPDFGERVASECSTDVARDMVVACFKRLHNTVAASFLDGFLKKVQIESLGNLLLDCIVLARGINATGSIVDFLREFAGLSDIEIADQLLDRLEIAKSEEEQNRLSYGLWIVACGITIVFQEEKIDNNWPYSSRDPVTIQFISRIREVMSNSTLSNYSRSSLEECIANLSKETKKIK